MTACPSESVGLVTALNLIEQLPKESSLLAFFAQVRGVLKPNGSLVAMVPTAISPFGTSTRHWDITHEWAFTPQQLPPARGAVELRRDPRVPRMRSGSPRRGQRAALPPVAGVARSDRRLVPVEVANTRGGIYTMDMMVRMRRGD